MDDQEAGHMPSNFLHFIDQSKWQSSQLKGDKEVYGLIIA